jgi:hypothetical protein
LGILYAWIYRSLPKKNNDAGIALSHLDGAGKKDNGLRNLDGDGERTRPVDDSSVLLMDLSCYSSLSFSLLFLLHDFICHVWRLQIFNSNM